MMPTLQTFPAVGPSPPEISRLYLSMAFLITACQSTPSGTCSHQRSCRQPSSWLQAAPPAPLRLSPGPQARALKGKLYQTEEKASCMSCALQHKSAGRSNTHRKQSAAPPLPWHLAHRNGVDADKPL